MARSRRGLERTNVRDGPPAAASRKIHRRHVIERNVTKKFVSTKKATDTGAADGTHASVRLLFFTRSTFAERAPLNSS